MRFPIAAIEARSLTKTYRVERRRAGRLGWLRSFVAPHYREIRGVDNVSFDVAKGEIVGLLGPNGAGKSTTVKILAGVLYPTSGDASILGLDPFKRRIDNARNIGVLFGQRSHLLWDLPPIDAFSLLRKVYGLSQAEYEARLGDLSESAGARRAHAPVGADPESWPAHALRAGGGVPAPSPRRLPGRADDRP